MTQWLSLITSLPTENAALRQRTWRALKATGAAVLRDGVYLMPAGAEHAALLERLATDVRSGGGSALVLRHGEPAGENFVRRFDRSGLYAGLLTDIAQARESLSAATAAGVRKQARKLRKAFAAVAMIDFFPGEAQRQAGKALDDLERVCARASAADEPQDAAAAVRHLDIADYMGRTWATRRRPWVDRLASAWLVRRFIDPKAPILWLERTDQCPPEAVGFDFDGAEFSHVPGLVTFEVLARSFRLNRPGLADLGLLVHCLDVGGAEPPETAGVETVLEGLKDSISNDDELLAAASVIFDGLYAAHRTST
jgi:hypothetical protein